MKTPKLLTIALVAVLALALAACGGGGKKSSGGGGDAGDLNEVADLARTAGDLAKTANSLSGGSGSSGGGGTASKQEHFKYDLSADGNGVVIKGINVVSPKTITIPEKIEGYPVVEVESIYDGVTMKRADLNLTSITFPNTVTKLGTNILGDYEKLTKVTLPPKITEIPDRAFSLSGITTIVIPDGITSIRVSAFSGCKSLKEITIPDSVTTIGNGAFIYCPELAKVNLPSHPITYGDANNTFEDCPKLSLAVRKAITDSGYKGTF